MEVRIWAERLSDGWEGFPVLLAAELVEAGIEDVRCSDVVAADLGAASDGPSTLVAVVGGGEAPSAIASLLQWDAQHDQQDLIVIVGSGFVGTDHRDPGAAMTAAAAVSLVRSRAARKNGRSRSNAVAVPEHLFGIVTEHRGPLAVQGSVEDAATAVAFLMSQDAGYLTGQVLFADGGRHLFSSMTS